MNKINEQHKKQFIHAIIDKDYMMAESMFKTYIGDLAEARQKKMKQVVASKIGQTPFKGASMKHYKQQIRAAVRKMKAQTKIVDGPEKTVRHVHEESMYSRGYRGLREGVGKWSVKKVKSYVNPYKMDDEEVYQNDGNDASYTKYHIKKNGKTVGRLRQDDYFGSMMARLGGKNMPELKHYGRNKKSGALSSLHAFMKSKTGKKWMARRKLDEVAPPGAKYERMVKHIKASGAPKDVAYATTWKAYNKKKKKALEESSRPYRLGIKGRKLKKSELERVAKQYAQWKKVKDKKGKSAADEYLSNKAGPTTAIKESKMSDWAIDFEEKHGRKPSNADLKRWHRLEKENKLQRKLNWKKIASRTGKVGRGGERG